VLADYDKDGGMAARVPRLAPRWLNEVTAQSNWQNFQPADFARLKKDFGVTWVVLPRPDPPLVSNDEKSMTCPYRNDHLQVCRLY
jgi:hypothetical protein